MKVDRVDWPAKPKFSMVPLLKLYSESLLTPLFNFYLFDNIVAGVALLGIFDYVGYLLNGFAAPFAFASLAAPYLSFFLSLLLF